MKYNLKNNGPFFISYDTSWIGDQLPCQFDFDFPIIAAETINNLSIINEVG